jgi:Protein of unknown function (DUF3551)
MHTICSSNLTTARRPGVTARPRPAAQARAAGPTGKSGSKIFQPTGSRQSGAEFGPNPRSTGDAPWASRRVEEAVAHDPGKKASRFLRERVDVVIILNQERRRSIPIPSRPSSHRSTKEAAMRTSIGMILAIATIAATTPLRAQTYDPNYPVCLQTYGRTGNYISCRYASIAQCQLSASGRAAQCITNPYFGGADRRRHRKYY